MDSGLYVVNEPRYTNYTDLKAAVLFECSSSFVMTIMLRL